MLNQNVELTLSNDEVVTLYCNWDQFTKDLNDDKTYIEQTLLDIFGTGDGDETILVMKNQIIMAQLVEEETQKD